MLSIVDDCPSSQDISQTHVMSTIQLVSFHLNQVEMGKHTDSGQDLESRLNNYRLYANTDTGVCGKTHAFGNEGDLESGGNEVITAG